jgi:type I restriction enzyme S subunit
MSEDELPPEGWVDAKLLEVLDYEGGAQPPKSTFSYEPRQGYVRLLQIRDFGEKPFPTYVADSSRLKKATAEDILLARYGGGNADDTLGRVCTGMAGAYNVALAKLVFPRDLLWRGYVAAFFRGPWFRNHVDRNSRSCQAGFNRSDLADLHYPLPPLAEQRRIVEKIEALLAEVNAARARLTKVPTILKRLRQSVLSAACSGHIGGSIDADSWPSVSVGKACSEICDCPHSTPKWSDTGEVCLRTTNFTTRGLDLSEFRRVSVTTYSERTKRIEPLPGDVVYSREGGILGIACIIPPGLKACLGQRMMLMRPDPDRLVSRYLELFLNSPETVTRVRELTGGTAAPHLNVGDVKEFELRLPPLPEQHEIVRHVDAMFDLADAIEARVTAATTRADKITQAILAEAFRGELVPTEAELARQDGRDYEPASALLARIRATRATNDEKPRLRPRASAATPPPATAKPGRRKTSDRTG